MTYAELQIATNFSFLRGASHPDELVAQAAAYGLSAIAVTDRNSFAGVVRAHVAAKKQGLRFIVGVRLDLVDAPSLLAYPTDRAAYGRLCRLLSDGKLKAEKGQCILTLADVAAHAAGQIFIIVPPEEPADDTFAQKVHRIRNALDAPCHIGAHHLYRGDDRARIAQLAAIARDNRLPLVALGDVHYHHPDRRALQDVLTAIREKTTVADAGFLLAANAERHLKPGEEMARRFADWPEAIANTRAIVDTCRFSLDELKYNYPSEPVPPGLTPQQHLEQLSWAGAAARYPDGVPEKIDKAIRRELALIAELRYAPYFLTVYDIVHWAREQGILCQGRGSAANSVVCYCLFITAVNPAEIDLLFDRFISTARKEPPDIDVDFEHERREEVMQYIYARYGRSRAGIAATVISYRARSAVREVAKALGLSEDVQTALAGTVWGWSDKGIPDEHVRGAGLDPADPVLRQALQLSAELVGFPRHLSQHVGGFVLTDDPLCEVVPIGNAAMDDRTFVEWDKDDLAALNILKIDVLALGMLTCIAKSFALMRQHHDIDRDLASYFPMTDKATYDMLCRADSLGVFQVESRAQMNMLPRLRPRVFYDLVIEVAIVRPGPIQGNMVHPYLRRRQEKEPVSFASPAAGHGPADELQRILAKTMGVPIFQEQAMRIAIEAAKFSPDEANELRYAMATFRRRGTIEQLEQKMVGRMIARGYDSDFAHRCFDQIKGFGEYGFPESHAASFALLVYVSSHIKCHHPAVFCAALLNAQPMGFYAPAQIVRDAREHGVEVREVDINFSHWDNTLEPCAASTGGVAVRLGFRQVKGVAEEYGRCIEEGREHAAGTALPSPLVGSKRDSKRSSGAFTREDGGERSEPGEGLFNQKQSLSPLTLPPLAGLRPQASAPSPTGERERAPYTSIADLHARTRTPRAVLETLAAADCFRSLGLDRRAALWHVKALPDTPDILPLFAAADARDRGTEDEVALPEMALTEHVVDDYQTLRLSLKAHPLSFLRPLFASQNLARAVDLRQARHGKRVRFCGIVIVRQRPGSAKGVVFMTLEDETGIVNAVVWPHRLERYRKVVMGSRMVMIAGEIQRQDDIVHLIADHMEDWSAELLRLSADEPVLNTEYARADEVIRPGGDRHAGKRKRDDETVDAPPLVPRFVAPRHPRELRNVIPKSRDFH